MPLVKPDLNVITNNTSDGSQVHPIFAISPSSGITYSWVSPPKSLPRKRTVFSRSQRIELEKKFQAQVRTQSWHDLLSLSLFFLFFHSLSPSLSLSLASTSHSAATVSERREADREFPDTKQLS